MDPKPYVNHQKCTSKLEEMFHPDEAEQEYLKLNDISQEREIEDFMNDSIKQSLQKAYSRYIRIGCLGKMFVCFICGLTSYLTINEENVKNNTHLCYACSTFLVLAFIVMIVCKHRAFYLVHFVPILLSLGIVMSINIALQSDEYRPSEYMIVTCCVAHAQMILIPNKWMYSSIAYAMAMIYFGYGVWVTYGLTSSDIILCIMLCVFWFTISCYFLSLKTKNLYSEILRNKKLIEEMRKILQILPLGVVIWPSKAGEQHFVNHEFSNKFTEIDKSLEELAAIDLELVDHNNKVIKQEFRNDLSKFLKAQQRLVKNKHCIVEQNAEVKCYLKEADIMAEGNEDSLDNKICNIKTLAIDWEGVQSYMHVFIDNTSVIKLEEIKNQLKLDEANNSLKMQKIMFASASHEFRTPLNAIINSFDIAMNSFITVNNIFKPSYNGLDDNKREEVELNVQTLAKFVNIGKSSSVLLMTLIEDILSLSKMEAGTFFITKENFNLPEVLVEIQDIFSMQCEQKKIKFILNLSPKVRNLVMYSDKGRLKQIIMNLVSNSMKFTFAGSITIECKLLRQDRREFAQFCVIDTGVGIKKKDQSKLFKLFGMISKTKSMNKNGTGIGLTVSKKYVEALGGDISLESAPGVGTSITFKIPISEEPEKEHLLKSDRSVCSYFESEFEVCDEGHHNQNLSFNTDMCSKGKFKNL
ncbi:unnamed protein product [Moneuplotes crassus]|uniref:histidine kinase n=2 Tax=Euplotes crassus TaxID=5936 RepID=A0AAD2DA60_EUPCR|nr:unnamed protein product [Moneuplotes crassus]